MTMLDNGLRKICPLTDVAEPAVLDRLEALEQQHRETVRHYQKDVAALEQQLAELEKALTAMLNYTRTCGGFAAPCYTTQRKKP